MDEHGNLPEGYKYDTKEVTMFQFICPHGDLCKKYDKVLSTKACRDDAVCYGSYHLFDKQQGHGNLNLGWAEACSKAEAGISEIQQKKSIVVDDNGEEVELIKWKDADKGPVNVARPKWGSSVDWSGRKRPRSESGNDCPETPITPPTPRPPPTPPSETIQKFARKGEVLMSRVELDYLIDGIDRSVDTCDHCAQYAKTAASVFETSAKALKDCKHHFERLRRI